MENCHRNLLLTSDKNQHWIQGPENGDQKVEPNARPNQERERGLLEWRDQ